jgi:hypothetical protein
MPIHLNDSETKAYVFLQCTTIVMNHQQQARFMREYNLQKAVTTEVAQYFHAVTV